MKKFVGILTSWGPAGLLIIATLDSAGIPLPAAVDALLIATAAVDPGAAYLSAALAVIGSLAGSLFLFMLARKGGQTYLDRMVSPERAARVRSRFHTYGLITVFIPALVPIIPLPLKVFVICAGVFGVSPGAYLLTVLAARVPRYFGLAWLGLRLGHDAGAWLKSHAWHLTLFAVVLGAALALLAHFAASRSPSSTA